MLEKSEGDKNSGRPIFLVLTVWPVEFYRSQYVNSYFTNVITSISVHVVLKGRFKHAIQHYAFHTRELVKLYQDNDMNLFSYRFHILLYWKPWQRRTNVLNAVMLSNLWASAWTNPHAAPGTNKALIKT